MKSYKRKKRLIAVSLSLLLLLVSIIGLASCAISYPEAESLMDSIKAQEQETKEIEDDFIKNTYEFSTDLFKRSIDMEENSLVSPLSVLLALAMTANGADTLTLEQMEDVLGMGTAIEDLNSYLYSYVKGLPSSDKAKLSIANSIWFRDDEGRLTIEEDFLQTNANFYGADIFKAAFDGQTVKDINKWVEDKTDGMIDQILEDIGSDHIMYLLNAIAFDAEWSVVYNKDQIISSEFQAISGEKQAVDLMNSEEDWYIDDGKATGFIKPYHGGHYSFVALLPNEDKGSMGEKERRRKKRRNKRG
jgi:serine protease inhibitor